MFRAVVAQGVKAVPARALRSLRSGPGRRASALALAGVMSFTTANTWLEAVNRDAFPTVTVTTVRDTDSEALAQAFFPRTFWVFFPGFGIDFCNDVEAAYADIIHTTGQSFCVAPSPVALDPSEIAKAVLDRVEGTRTEEGQRITLRLYGISMGGMLAYDVAQVLRRADSNLVIDAMIFDSSPAGPDSVSGIKQLGVWWGDLVNRLPNPPDNIPNPIKGGPLNRFLVHAGEAVADNVRAGTWPLTSADISFAWYKATRVTSGGVANQLDYITSFYPPSWPENDHDIHFAYFRAQDAQADTTVDVGRAVSTYDRLVAPHPLQVVSIVGGRHASANDTQDAYRSALAAFIKEAGMTTIDDLRELARATRHIGL